MSRLFTEYVLEEYERQLIACKEEYALGSISQPALKLLAREWTEDNIAREAGRIIAEYEK